MCVLILAGLTWTFFNKGLGLVDWRYDSESAVEMGACDRADTYKLDLSLLTLKIHLRLSDFQSK